MAGQLGSLAGRATPVQPAGPFCGPARRRPARVKTLEARTWALQAAAQEAASPPAAAAAAAAPQPPAAPVTSHPQVRPIQPQPAQLTPEGLVPNTASLDAVPPALQPLLEAAVATCRAQLGRQLVGVYARGSLVQAGCFVPGLSDADFLALYLEDPSICSSSSTSSSSSSSSSSSIGDDGGSCWRERDAAAVEDRLRRQAAQMQQAFPQCVKVELKAVPLSPSSPLHQLAFQWQRQQGEEEEQQQQQPHVGSGGAPVPPLAVLDHREAALAFQLKTQAVCLWGWDLPRLLPDTAALPRLQLLPSLVDDVEAALRHTERQLALLASHGSRGSASQDAQESHVHVSSVARAVRWALKRCLRAAFELASCCGTEGGGDGDSSNSRGGRSRGSSGSAPAAGGVFTRDLYWCQHYALLRYPQLRSQLAAALERYVCLDGGPAEASSAAPASQPKSAPGSSSSGSTQQHPGQLEDVQASIELASSLAAELDGLFLQAMLQPEPGWLTHHYDGSSGAAPAAGAAQQPTPAMATGSSRGSWGQKMRVRLWAAAAAAGGGGRLQSGLLGAPPPPVTAAVSGSVLTLDWRQPAAREQAAAIIAATAAGLDSSSSGSSSNTLPQPVLLKGAAAHWPAVQRWSLRHLVAAGLEGRARLAPSLQFPFTEPRLAALVAEQRGLAALPSCLARIDAGEFVARMQRGNPCGLPPLVHGGGSEYLYFQAQLPPALLQDVDLAAAPFVLPAASRGCSDGSSSGAGSPAQQLRQTQAARVWVGPQGAVSPAHYDTSHSFLTQIRGRKRMLFWSPDQLPCLYCYPDTHLLRRRSRVNMHAPLDAAKFPLFARAAAAEALLEPGDVVFFPSRWAHYTESLDCSISVTCRFEAAD